MADLKFNIVYDRKHVASAVSGGIIEIRFTCGKQQKYFSTGIKVLRTQWNGRSNCIVKHPDGKALNLRLDSFVEKAGKVRKAALMDDGFDFASISGLFKGDKSKEIDFPTYCEQRTAKRRVCENTRERYRVFIRFLRSWDEIKSFADITVAKVRSMDEYLHEKGLGQGTVYNYHKYLKLFINDAVIDSLVTENPYRRLPFKIGRGDKQYVDCLTMEQFEAVRSLRIATLHIAKARDLFLFQCYTGLAYSDLMAFSFEDCELMDGKYFYHNKRTKTDVDFVLQLLPPAVELLKKYGYKLPRLSNQKYNDYLKAVGAMAGIEGLHSHMGRATAATMFLSKGMPINVVSKVLGHTNLRQTQRYARTLSKDVRSAFDMLEGKI